MDNSSAGDRQVQERERCMIIKPLEMYRMMRYDKCRKPGDGCCHYTGWSSGMKTGTGFAYRRKDLHGL